MSQIPSSTPSSTTFEEILRDSLEAYERKQRQTLPPTLWPPSFSPAPLPVPFATYFKPKPRRSIHLNLQAKIDKMAGSNCQRLVLILRDHRWRGWTGIPTGDRYFYRDRRSPRGICGGPTDGGYERYHSEDHGRDSHDSWHLDGGDWARANEEAPRGACRKEGRRGRSR
ncbi:hypothetical protein EI94DRAFT_1707198 [Lactarius quietus]|nr:hypothetical protein EI94DRAFT_1707198 [Lactarius quietus]